MGTLVRDVTNIALNNGITFTSEPYEVGQYSSLVIACKTDQSGKLVAGYDIEIVKN